MGEPTPCLVRSLSQPSDSFNESGELDPLRTLRTSVSFGRYISDTSSWEKWSCFSNNRYLEEAEKISKPGSVAEKKALLEAHFKKISAKKANTGTNFQEPSKVNKSCTDILMVLESSETASQEFSDEKQERRGLNVIDSDVERNDFNMDKIVNVEMEKRTRGIVEKVTPCEILKPPKIDGDRTKNVSSKKEMVPIIDNGNQGNLDSTCKKKQSLNSSKKFTDILASKLRSSIKLSPSKFNKEDNATQTSKNVEKRSLEKKRPTLKSVHMSVDYSSRLSENNKKSFPFVQKTAPKGIETFSKESVAGTLAQTSATTKLQKRIKNLETLPVSKSIPEPQSPAIDSKTHGHNPQSPTVASSRFSLRCEGRVAKRKEFFQKLEEKQKAKEAEKVSLQAKSKKKSDDDLKTMRQSTSCGWKPSVKSRLDTELPNNNIKKIPVTRRDNVSPAKTNDATKANEKNKRTLIRSSCTISRKPKKENSPPNIQRWL